MLECDITHRRPVVVLCMMSWLNQMNPFYGVVAGAYVPLRVTRGALVAHRYTYSTPRCRSSTYRRTFIPLSVSLCNDLAHPVLNGVELVGLKSSVNALGWPMLFYPDYSRLLFSRSLFSVFRLYCAAGVFALTGCR